MSTRQRFSIQHVLCGLKNFQKKKKKIRSTPTPPSSQLEMVGIFYISRLSSHVYVDGKEGVVIQRVNFGIREFISYVYNNNNDNP